MIEKTKTVYIANDGTEFNTKEECYKYEAKAKKISSFIRTLRAIKEFCYQQGECSKCPFLDGSYCKITFADTDDTSDIPCNWKF